MNTDETYELENRVYVNPTQSRDEQLQFIENLRSTQEQANQQIAQDTYNLGTQVPSNLGGLTSGAGNANSYWMSRYQAPQVASQIADLYAVLQADTLKNTLSQHQKQMENRLTQAYRAYRKRKAAEAKAAASGTGTGYDDIKINTESTSEDGSLTVGNDKLEITPGQGGSASMTTTSPSLDGDGYWVRNEDTGESVFVRGSERENPLLKNIFQGLWATNPGLAGMATAAAALAGKTTANNKES